MTLTGAIAPDRPTSAAEPYRLAFVGGGPRATYALERLSATVDNLGAGQWLEVHVFEPSGEFGAGQVHSPSQARTSYLNRISGQVGFAADDSVTGARPLLPAADRPTLYEWCRNRYAETGEPDFDVSPQDVPKRYVHGLALRDMFDGFARRLSAHPRVEIRLHVAEVTDIEPLGDGLRIVTRDGDGYLVDEALLLTGHSHHDPARAREGRRLADLAARAGAHHVPHPYPLRTELSSQIVGRDSVVGCIGMGLTAIDVILHLTEGRGGTFVDDGPDGLRYRPSGDEPAGIVALSRSGLFNCARPYNDKERMQGAGDHPGTFLTREAIDQLRASAGRPVRRGGEERLQLDFERNVLPLVLLEMAHTHYVTLFGPGTALLLTQRVMPGYLDFLAGRRPEGDEPTRLLAPMEKALDEITDVLESVARGASSVEAEQRRLPWPVRDVLLHWTKVVLGPASERECRRHLERGLSLEPLIGGGEGPTGLERDIRGNRFDWERVVSPLAADGDADSYRQAVLEFMRRDRLWSLQGNLTNPHKAAADGVWRDLRSVISYAVDEAGLTASSQRTFLQQYVRCHNRLVNGAAPELSEKLAALIRHGVLDVSAGPEADLRLSGPRPGLVVEGPHTGARRPVDVVVEARVHGFDPRLDIRPLYRNLLSRGVVRLWRNESADGDVLEPGGIDLTRDFHAIRSDGSPDPRITVLGVPTEGARTFNISALRPDADHYIMQDVLTWLSGFWSMAAAKVGEGIPG
ncbi:FAD/NAD(P)-binding protein [Streptomyces sp. NBC_01275]|uniref:FAD/NAD(P)-binding protein n=1 Tax=Streptomyces sp. NBC_01275 TaxID=2903807 RepID=UPI0022570609|nr:FAD/NAD(P)-binding protein [Streptomyces sp. NBC_01275]MCX4763953.1 FAD/NAD(P)-binding protein [Streptomyces sp. NBC_01275]